MEMDEVTGYHLDHRISKNSKILKENLNSNFPCPSVGKQIACLVQLFGTFVVIGVQRNVHSLIIFSILTGLSGL